jgi:hypothetical protein
MPRPLPGDTYVYILESERERANRRENTFLVLNCSKYDAFTYVSEMFGHAILVGLDFCPVEKAIACWDNLKE